MKRILFINLRSHLVERMEPLYEALKLGVEVVLLADKVPNIDKGYIKDENIIITDTYDMQSAVKKVVEFSNKKKIDGVLTWADKDVELVSLIADRLNLAAPTIKASQNARNKFLMRQAIAKNYPELCPKFQRVTTFKELKDAVGKIGFPGILKPVGASGSKTIIKIYENNDLEKIFNRLKEETKISNDKIYTYFPNEYIYEELLSGDEMSIEGFVSSKTGEIIIAGMTDKYVTDKFSTEYKEIEPSQKPAQNLKIYRDKLKKAIEALKISGCSFHAEVKVDGTNLKIIEIAARPGGGFITTHLVKIASGISFIEQNIKNALKEPIDENIDFEKWSLTPKAIVGQEDLMATKNGIVTKIIGLGRILEDPKVKLFLPLKKVGDKVVLPPKNYGNLYTARVIVVGKNISEVEKSLLNVKNKYQLEVK